MKNTKILCICNKGNVRSVATKIALNRRGYNNVIAIGGSLLEFDIKNSLCKWADIILLAKPDHARFIKPRFHNKIKWVFMIGEDTWGTPVNLHLEEIINVMLNRSGLY